MKRYRTMAISITSDPAQWNTGEKIVWTAVEAANNCAIAAMERRLQRLNDVIKSIDEIMGIEHIEEENDQLSFNAKIVLRRLQGEKIRMDTDRHIEGITELAKKGIITYNKRSKKWRVSECAI
jgi:hypothetical protein